MSIDISKNIMGDADLDFTISINYDEFDANTYNIQIFGINHHILMMISAPVITFNFSRNPKNLQISENTKECKLTAVYRDDKKSKFDSNFSYQVVT